MNKDALERETRIAKKPKADWPCPPRTSHQEWKRLSDDGKRARIWSLFRRANGETIALYPELHKEFLKEVSE